MSNASGQTEKQNSSTIMTRLMPPYRFTPKVALFSEAMVSSVLVPPATDMRVQKRHLSCCCFAQDHHEITMVSSYVNGNRPCLDHDVCMAIGTASDVNSVPECTGKLSTFHTDVQQGSTDTRGWFCRHAWPRFKYVLRCGLALIHATSLI